MAQEAKQAFVLRVGNDQYHFKRDTAEVRSTAGRILEDHLPPPCKDPQAPSPREHRRRFGVAFFGRFGQAHEVLGVKTESEARKEKDRANDYVKGHPKRLEALHHMVDGFMGALGIEASDNQSDELVRSREELTELSMDLLGRHQELFNAYLEPLAENHGLRVALDRAQDVAAIVSGLGVVDQAVEAAEVAQRLAA